MYVQASPGRTVVRVLKGQGAAKAMSSQSTVEIAANQSLEMTPAGAGQVRVTPLAVQQEALAQTALSTTTTQAATNAAPPQEQAPPPPVKKSHLKRNLLILAVIGAAGAGAAAAAAGHGSGSSTTTPPPAATGTPTIPPQ